MRISDWSSDVCSSDLASSARATVAQAGMAAVSTATAGEGIRAQIAQVDQQIATSAEQLGPNHPAMYALRGQRVALERQLAQAQAAAQRAASMARSDRKRTRLKSRHEGASRMQTLARKRKHNNK